MEVFISGIGDPFYQCSECDEYSEIKVVIETYDDWHPAYVCQSCLEKALELIKDNK